MVPKSDPLACRMEIEPDSDFHRVNIQQDATGDHRSNSENSSPGISVLQNNQSSPTITFSTSGSNLTDVRSSAYSEYLPSSRSEIDFAQEQHFTEDNIRHLSFVHKLMQEKSMQYLGIPTNGLYILESLQETTNISERDIMIVLRKIRLNESFDMLSDCFGLSRSRISQIFDKNVSKIAAECKELIFWPDTKLIKKFLPYAFLLEHSAVQSIIDCFEIQIQKPIDPVAQSVTFSQYKSCNTIKYLAQITDIELA
ncbi:uncharacterized protein LOC134210488 [Armigeres subalbatus]|uniref:uncharacterized protein LOC134210488 n=1 Tax=Armigeres subalbatus TaxID=124917 RepID=UPI002ED67C5C